MFKTMSWSFSPFSQEQKSQHCLLDDILFDDQDKSKKANQMKVHPFRVSSAPRLPPVPSNFDDFFSQSSQKDITSTQAFRENFSQFGKKININTQTSRAGKRNLTTRHQETPTFNYPKSNLFHSPPKIDLGVDDDDEEYMYPEDSPELFTPPDAYSSSYSIHEQGIKPTDEFTGTTNANKGLASPSQQFYDTSFRTPNPLFIPAKTPSYADEDGREKLRSTAEIPEQFRSVFSQFPYFNIVQSRVFDEVFYSDKPLVICAPTGAGKTVIFELAIIRLLMTVGASTSKTKIVYMAPMKALCSERCNDWSSKFGPLGLKCREVTGDSELDDYFELQDTHIVTTTPEKWDSMTRKWKDNKSLVQSVRLFLVDEVHILNDGDRGATVEAVISRMKTVHTALSRGAGKQQASLDTNMRLIAVSATIPNVKDIAAWIGGIDDPASSYSMDDSYRPVKLRKVVLGFPMHSNMSEFKFDLSLNYKLSGIIQTYSDRKPTLVFCSTRKSTQQAANTLIKDARFIVNSQHRQRLTQIANSLHDSKLRELVICGVGYHHAGLDSTDRKSIENAFLKGELPVLFATSTLAVGVNLPAHLVIIKSTHCYQIGVYTEYSETQVLQMIGRAGRPQFDTSATAVIMTTTASKENWSSLLQGTQNIESSLHHHLIEHLNAEIVLHTISDVSIALEWLKSTFLFIRIQKNPTHYGIPAGLSKEALEQKLQDLCIQNLNTLEKATLIKMDDGFDLKPGEPGRLMARYCIAFDSIKQFLSIEGSECLADMVTLVSKCKEFSDVKLRVNEKRILNGLNKDKNKLTIRFPINGKIKSTDQKVSCLIQATLGCLSISEFSLNQDVTKIFRCGQRVTRCLVELSMLQNKFKSLLNAIIFAKCMKARLWENSKYVSKQIEKVGTTLSTMLVNAGLTSFKKIEETNPREIELIVNRHPPFGSQIREAAMSYPKYEVSVEQKGRYTVKSSEILISVTMTNWMKRQLSTGSKRVSHFCFLVIGDADNNVIYKQRLGDAVFFKEGGVWSKTVDVHRATKSPELSINLISQDYVGVDVATAFTPYYSGSYFPANKASAETNERQKVPQSTPAPATLPGKPCNHRCINKNIGAHECCKTGVMGSRSKRVRTDKEKEPPVTFVITPQSNNGKGMNGFLDQLHQRTFALPRTPAQKRLKVPISTAPVSTGHVENFSSTLAERFSYNRRPSLLQYAGSNQKPSSTQVIVKTARPTEDQYRKEVDLPMNETNLPREGQLKQNKQLIPDDIYQGDDDFFSNINLDPEDEFDDLPSLYEYGLSGTGHPTPNPSSQVKATRGSTSAYFSSHNKASSSKTVGDQEPNQKMFEGRSNSFNSNSYRTQNEPAPKRKSVADISNIGDDDFFSGILDQEDEFDDSPSLYEYELSGTDHPTPSSSSQVKATQGCTSAYFSCHNKACSSSKTVRDQEQSRNIFKGKNNSFNPNSYRTQDGPAPKRKSVDDISNICVTKTPTKPVPHPQPLSSILPGLGNFQAATRQFNNMKSTTIPKHDYQYDRDGREYDQVKRKEVTGGAFPKRSLSLSSKVPGWNQFKEMKNKAVQDKTEDAESDPNQGNPPPSKLEQEVAGVKLPLVPVFFSSGANQRLQPDDDQDAFSDIFHGVF